jgi:hypothetical protein
MAADAYDTLAALSADLHLLLLEPGRFLFGTRYARAAADGGGTDGAPRVPLEVRREKLYGRETEVAQIQEAFCRVSTGRSEAFFIGEWRRSVSGSSASRIPLH